MLQMIWIELIAVWGDANWCLTLTNPLWWTSPSIAAWVADVFPVFSSNRNAIYFCFSLPIAIDSFNSRLMKRFAIKMFSISKCWASSVSLNSNFLSIRLARNKNWNRVRSLASETVRKHVKSHHNFLFQHFVDAGISSRRKTEKPFHTKKPPRDFFLSIM